MPNVYSDTLSHDAVMVWLAPPSRDVVGGVAMRTAPPPAVGDDVAVAELVVVSVAMAGVVVDDTPAAEAVVIGMPLPVVAIDAAGPGEAVAGLLSVLLPAVGDDLTPAEAVTVGLPLPGVSVVDDLTPTEAVELRMALVVADALVLDEAVVVQMPVQVVAVDGASPTELALAALNVLTLAVADDVVVVDVAFRLQPITLVVVDTTVVDERRNVSMLAPKKIKIHGRAGTR